MHAKHRPNSFGQLLAFVSIVLSGWHDVGAQEPGQAQRPASPNFLFIAVDDLNDWVEPLGGHPQAKTPNFRRLAERGTTFTNAHCQSPLCNPSRTSLLTGLRPTTTGVYALQPSIRQVPGFKDVVSLPQALAAGGYQTLTTGKIWHDAYPEPGGRKPGTEFSTWGLHGSHGPFPSEKFVKTPSTMAAVDWGVFPDRDEALGDYQVASWAIERLKSGIEDPFFLAVGFRRPHVPCFAPQKWFDLYPENALQLPKVKADDRADLPKFADYLHWDLPEPRLVWLERENQWKNLVRSYLASISFMDAQLGRLLDALESSGHADDTVVVLWSDHGWHLGEKAITGKNTLWDRSTRVPMIWSGPGIISGGRCDEPVELLDIYPTLLELAGLPARPALEGLSLVPQLRHAATPRTRPALTTHGPGNHGLRARDWRYIRYADGSEELYDMRVDPNEWNNLAGEAKYAEVKADLARWLPVRNAPPAPGSVSRLIEMKPDGIYWETKMIDSKAPLPGTVFETDAASKPVESRPEKASR
ncbi:sulfatase-like hydrolase/transferase [bacterium]|nr:sulfatase-like hydrolase/transferase [bacterium]